MSGGQPSDQSGSKPRQSTGNSPCACLPFPCNGESGGEDSTADKQAHDQKLEGRVSRDAVIFDKLVPTSHPRSIPIPFQMHANTAMVSPKTQIMTCETNISWEGWAVFLM